MNKIEYTKKFKIVRMNEINISSSDFPIIGTQGLGPCVAFLVYCEEKKVAIVAHIPDNTKDYFPLLLDIIAVHELKFPLKYKVIKGYYDNGYKIKEVLEKEFKKYPNLFIPFENIKENAINTDYESTSREFAFNTLTGEFVTEKVFFGHTYNRIHEANNLTR